MRSQRSLPAGYVFRAKLILMLSEGATFASIRERLGTSNPTILRWKERFLVEDMDGLDTNHPGQKPYRLTAASRAKILNATRKQPADGSTHWSCRKLANALGISKDVVCRVWREAGVKPHCLERYMASNDPDFEKKAADTLALYLTPPQHAAVFCVDEKSAIQALERLDPALPLSPGRPTATASNTTGTARRHSMLPSIPRPGRFTAKQRPGIPASRSLPSSAKSYPHELPAKRSTLFWTTCQPEDARKFVGS